MAVLAFLTDYLWDNEEHNRAEDSGGNFLRQFLDVACFDGYRAADAWDKARRRDGR